MRIYYDGPDVARCDEALEHLIGRHTALLERRARARLPFGAWAREERAQDIVQVVWIRVMDTKGSRRARWAPERGPFRPWLLTILDNCVRDEVRKESRSPVSSVEPPDAADPRQEARFRHLDDTDVVTAWMAKLSGELQRILILKFWVGLNQAEIAKEFGVSEATISRRCNEGCNTLRDFALDPRTEDQRCSSKGSVTDG